MDWLELTLPTAAENLALDQALLERAELDDFNGQQSAGEVLRVWQPAAPMVVLGKSSRPEIEVNLDTCQDDGVPVLRRCSGGATIVTGPGCLMYAVVLRYDRHPHLRLIDQAHRHVLDLVRQAITPLVPEVKLRGQSDLVLGKSGAGGPEVGERKFSGNSLRCLRHCLLYHGTLLLDFPLELVERYLRMPLRQPEYRQGRSHADFLTNLPTSGPELITGLRRAFQADTALADWPRERTAALAGERYGEIVNRRG